MEECIFCKIIEGSLPSKTIYEDNLIKIIMNINPATDGHLLVISKDHKKTIMDTENKLITHSLDIIRKTIYPLLKEKLNCEGLTLAQNNECGQEIKHFHIHLIPRYSNDGADFQYDKSKISDLEDVYKKITNKNTDKK